MATLFRNLLGTAPETADTAGDMRAVLYDLRQERGHCEALVNSARATATRFQDLSEPLARAGDDMTAISGRLSALEQRLAGFEGLASQLQGLDEGAERLAQRQRQADARLARSEEAAQKLESLLAEMAGRVDTALDLREQLDSFLSMETPFRKLQGEADALRGEVGSATERLARVREQHERVMEEHSVAHAKLGAFDRRHDELARSVDEKEQRVAAMEQALTTLHEVQQLADDAKQRLGTLKVLGDYVAAKTAALEAQRDSVERALARAEALDEAVRQMDAGLSRQQENARSLAALQEQAMTLQTLSEEVLAKATGMEQLRDEAGAQLAAVRTEVAEATAEAKRSAERFAFESRGIEAVNQRVNDLRSTVSDLESRFATVNESRQSAAELQAQLAAATSRVEALAAEIGRLDVESERVQGLRRDLDAATQVATQAADRLAILEEAQPAVDAALHDVEQLRGVHALVTDTLERAQHAGTELARLREEQNGTRTWLADVEGTLAEVGERVAELRKIAPGIEFVQGQVKRINESLSGIESRREVIEDMQRRMAELTALGGTLDERGRELQTRMDGAEQRFVNLAAHADEVERLGATVAGLTTSLQEAENDVREVGRNVVVLHSRCESIETLVERTRALRQEIEQRQHALEEASQQLQQASELRQQAAASAQELDERAKQLAAALAAAERQADRVGAVSQQLEDRADSLRFVDRRLGEFEERLARWELVDQEVARSLEQITARQATVEALQADIDRMAGVAEKTADNVRAITAAQGEIDESRALVDDLLAKLREARDESGALEERRRQLGQAEARLARADALLIDVRSGIQVLQSQKVVVDQAIEKAGSIEFLLRQADATIRNLRDERDMSTRLKAAMATVDEEEQDEESMEARA
jgi:chromosome segregation ATPase